MHGLIRSLEGHQLPMWLRGVAVTSRPGAIFPTDGAPASTLGLLLLNLSGHQDVVRDLSFTPSGSLILVSASRDKTLRIWDLNKHGMEVMELLRHS